MQGELLLDRKTLPAWAVRAAGRHAAAARCWSSPPTASRACAGAAAGRALDAVDAELRAAVLRLCRVRLPARAARRHRRGARGARAARRDAVRRRRPRRPGRARARGSCSPGCCGGCSSGASAGAAARRRGRGARDAAGAARGRRGGVAGQPLHRAAAAARRCTCGCCSPPPSCARARRPRSRSSRSGCCRSRCSSPSTRTSSAWARARSPGRRCCCSPAATSACRRRCCGASRFGLRGGRRDARAGAARSRPDRAAARGLRDHDPRAAVLRGPGIARWNGVGSATIGRRCPRRDVIDDRARSS